MLFSNDVVFIHVPKTGGISIREYLLRTLPHPVYYTHPTALPNHTDPGTIWIPGIQHETLAETREIVTRYGHDLVRFPLILVVIRNPYALEVSRYAFFNTGNAPDNPNSALALDEDFEGFVCKNTDHAGERTIDKFYMLDGRILPNLRILRLEHLGADLQLALQSVGIEATVDLPHLNKSHHTSYEFYYTPTSEQAVYRKYKWMFDAGFYERMHPGETSHLAVVEQELRDAKQTVREIRQEYNHLLELYYASDRWAHELEATARWAHELEATAKSQAETLRTYRRVLAPLGPFARLARGMKQLLTTRQSSDGKGSEK